VLNPANQGNGIAVITVTVSETGPSASFSRSFTVYIRPSGNTLPTLNVVSTGTTPEDTPITVPVTIGDAETAASGLILGALSSNPVLVPTNNIVFTGTGNSRSMTVTPLADRSGSSTITVWVLDSQFGYTQSNFVLQVTAVNDVPSISAIPNQVVLLGTNMPPVSFTIGDAETPAQNLTLAATSSNQGLLPNGNIAFGGAGTDRSVVAYPLPGQTGSANITITVTDGNGAPASTSFALAVLTAQPPRLTIRVAGSNVELLWPTEAGSAYVPQGRDQLGSGSWTDITASPTISGTNNVVTQPRTGAYRFFRLRN
jgi:hypothetical protein